MNRHEDGAIDRHRLLERGVGVEAGAHSGTAAAQHFITWSESHRVLAEITDTDPRAAIRSAVDPPDDDHPGIVAEDLGDLTERPASTASG
ncbi:hypothetical protein ACFUN7_06390 [Streptomyces sp. NPDC057236]|uniref:hypothetical protein n=1 Tax=Streptomyces sp. NPDC057236 TaxID=3346059 RepID=UPI0036411ABF